MPASPQKTKAPPEGKLAQVLAVLEANTTLLAFFFGLCFVAALLVLAIWFPQPTPFQYTVFRIVLALAAAGIAGIIPGMIRLTVKPGTALLIHAGGALAVFVMVYLLAPAPLPPPKEQERPAVLAASNNTDTVEEIPPDAAPTKITIGQYIDNRDGTITDTETGLMWKRCSEGLSGETCEEGEIEKYTWDDAVKRFKNIEYAGYADWRLPTIEELKTLVYCSNGRDKDIWCNDDSERPTINQQAFPNTTALFYWSGSPYAYGSDYAWGVRFSYGDSAFDNRDDFYAVRLVRGGQ